MATLKDRFGDTPVTAEETQRAAFERAARSIAADHWFGVGANNFVSVNNTGGYAARAGLDWAPALRSKPAHNAYLVARAETGWAGEITLILLLGGLAYAGVRAGFRMRRSTYMGLPLGCAGAIIAVAFHSNYEYAILVSETQRFIFMNAALIAGCMAIMHRAEAERRRAGNRTAAPVAAIQPAEIVRAAEGRGRT
jgi:O-antigen ligase